MDVFSRKAMIYGINSKESKMIITYIIDFCSNHNIPKEFSSDNGAEFKNKFFDDYCQMNNIKFLHGMPFNARAQGTIERFNYTIKKNLLKEFIANGNNLIDFQKVKSKIINYYNNKYHRLMV